MMHMKIPRSTNHRYELLDGMRGVAAVAVVLFHFAWQAGWETVIAPHAYLAVDFFFMLSGFVLAGAYSRRLADRTMSLGSFMLARVVRLYPMIFVGTAIGLVVHMSLLGTNEIDETSGTVFIAFLLGLLLEPFTYHPGSGVLHFELLLDGPLWSLFWEMFSNLIYGIFSRVLPHTMWNYVAAVFMVIVAIYSARHNGLFLGGAEWFAGFARVGFSFFAGIVIWSYRDRFPFVSIGAIPLVGVLAAIFIVPILPHVNKLFDLAAVFVAFPSIIHAASRTSLSGNQIKRIADMLGEVSYPLYAIHGPFLWYAKFAYDRYHLGIKSLSGLAIVAVGSLGTIALSYAILRLIDLPIRKAIGGHLKLARSRASVTDS